jgi:TatD DNase family protein
MCDPVFDNDRARVLERARRTGVEAIIAVGENLADATKNLELSKKYPMLKPAAGLYPTHLNLNQAHQMADFIRQNASRLAAIGEVGLDYWVVKAASDREIQKEILKKFIKLSKELNLPLNIHSRSAGRHAIALF